MKDFIRIVGVCALFCTSVVAPVYLYERNYEAAIAWFVAGIFILLMLQDGEDEK